MIVLATGSRNWTNRDIIRNELLRLKTEYKHELWVCQGGARGADKLVRDVCEEFFIECKTYDADWVRYGKAAGVIRNQQMLDDSKPDLVIAFLHTFSQNRGTKDMISRAEKAGYKVLEFRD